MSNSRVMEYVAGIGPHLGMLAPEVEFVNGPRSGDREVRADRPPVIRAAGGSYRRGVSCADDGVLRYIWSPGLSTNR